jgi:hypothetical protein
MNRKIVLFELNEVPVRIFSYFCRTNPHSTLASRFKEMSRYETWTEDQGWLEPWVTWPTVHRGVANDRHGIRDFGQNLAEIDCDFPPLWKILTANGIKTGVCGSLHTYPIPADLNNYTFYIPDTFAAGAECFPQDVTLFQEFNLSMVRESARDVSKRVPWKSALAVLAKAPELGFKLSTAADLGRQLIAEQFHPWQKVRRRTYQSVLAFDIFMNYLDRTRPDMATFFTNHVASSMHRYWAALFPGDYEQCEFTTEWKNTYRHEIDFTMGKVDHFFSRLVHFADENPEYQIWVATSMGQAATRGRPCESQLYCVDPRKFMAALGVRPDEWEARPAMFPQCNVVVGEPKIAVFRTALSNLLIDGKPTDFREAENGFFSLDFGQEDLQGRDDFVQLRGNRVSPGELGLKAVQIEDQTAASAFHIPNGTLLIYDPRDRSEKADFTQISTLDIAPVLLQNFSVPVPEYMQGRTALAG